MHIAKLLKSRLVEGPDQSLRAQRVGRGKRPTSKDGQMACKNYQITITEVFASYSSDKHWSVKISVDALLYGKNTLHDVLRHVRPKEVRGKSPICTWIHRAITPHVGNTEFPSVFFPFLNYEANTRQENRNNYIQEVYEEYLRQEEVIADIPPEDMLPATNRLSRDFVGHKVLPLPDGMNLESYPYLEEDSDSDFSDHGAEGNDDDLQAEEKALIKSYLYGPPALHVRRTLDQFYYHMLSNTKDRDQDQVVSRWCQNVKHQSRHNLLMVDQLWLWKASQSHPSIAGQSETYVITCFPSRTGTGHGYQRSLDDLRHLVLDPSHRKRSPISKPEDLVSRVLESCCSVFDRMQNAEMLRFFQMFDDSIGSIDDQESRLFRDFQRGSTRLLELSPINKYYNEQKHTLLVDLLDIREEIKLLVEIKDIRDEVNIILTVLGIQWTLLERLSLHGSESPALTQGSVATNIVQTDIDDFTRMDSQARTIQEKLNTLMDLKQKAANAWEARESRETTVAASKQGNTVLVFTVVTIVFLPLSFMSSFFAIEIAAFPKDATTGETNWPLGIVTGLLFGISLSLSIPLIVFALNMESCSAMYRELRYNHLTRIGISIVGLLPFLASSDTPGSSRRRWTERLQKSHGAYADQPDRTGHTQGATYSTEIFGETKHAMSYRSTTSSHTLTENLTDRNHFSSHSAKNGSSKRRKYV
ncbi:hypothetical protein T440DRAFT_406141 [Plenodomus tracheiphilus IPT5]|uniref:Cora-domain-containing protein n=1 Tax=Plenodomus tracheiphilus IPT5 TaxID=1408161 RepID=A0A6A7AVY8_9PLEO|nr:hypothetical protein T440DRAFT_406141 [Plenodomus tracheiphilus IPT5]